MLWILASTSRPSPWRNEHVLVLRGSRNVLQIGVSLILNRFWSVFWRSFYHEYVVSFNVCLKPWIKIIIGISCCTFSQMFFSQRWLEMTYKYSSSLSSRLEQKLNTNCGHNHSNKRWTWGKRGGCEFAWISWYLHTLCFSHVPLSHWYTCLTSQEMLIWRDPGTKH